MVSTQKDLLTHKKIVETQKKFCRSISIKKMLNKIKIIIIFRGSH